MAKAKLANSFVTYLICVLKVIRVSNHVLKLKCLANGHTPSEKPAVIENKL